MRQNQIFSVILLIPSICHAGYFLDKPSVGGLSQLGDRFLNHNTGRFLTTDRKKQYYSGYNYGSGNVIKFSDPTGDMMADESNEVIKQAISVEQHRIPEIIQGERTTPLKEVGGKGERLENHNVIIPTPEVMVPRAPSILFKTAKEGKLSKLSIPKVFFNERGDAELKIVDGASNPNLRLKYRPEGITPGRGETVIREFPEVLLEGIEPAYQEFFGLKHDTDWDWRIKHVATSPLRRPVIQPLKILETEPKRSDDF